MRILSILLNRAGFFVEWVKYPHALSIAAKKYHLGDAKVNLLEQPVARFGILATLGN